MIKAVIHCSDSPPFEELLPTIDNLYNTKGYSLTMIEEELGLIRSTLWVKLKKVGFKLRSRKDAQNIASINGRKSKVGVDNPNFNKDDKLRECYLKRGIYFLYNNDELVYIGKSITDIRKRLKRHIFEETKIFDRVDAYFINSDTDVHLAEVYLINKFSPKYNKNEHGDMPMTLEIQNIDKVVKESISISLKD